MTDQETCLLFVYGLLQPGFHPPNTTRSATQSRLRGRLFDLGEYPAAVDIGSPDSWIDGCLLEINPAELAALDEFEKVEGEGGFQRIRASVETGEQVWVYAYTGPIPEGLPPQSRWPCPQRS